MKEDLVTLQSLPVPFPISLDYRDGYSASNHICLYAGVYDWVKDSSQRCPTAVWQFRFLSNFTGKKMGEEDSVIGGSSQKMVKEHSEEYFEDL